MKTYMQHLSINWIKIIWAISLRHAVQKLMVLNAFTPSRQAIKESNNEICYRYGRPVYGSTNLNPRAISLRHAVHALMNSNNTI